MRIGENRETESQVHRSHSRAGRTDTLMQGRGLSVLHTAGWTPPWSTRSMHMATSPSGIDRELDMRKAAARSSTPGLAKRVIASRSFDGGAEPDGGDSNAPLSLLGDVLA